MDAYAISIQNFSVYFTNVYCILIFVASFNNDYILVLVLAEIIGLLTIVYGGLKLITPSLAT